MRPTGRMEKKTGSEAMGSVQSEYGPVPVMAVSRPGPDGPERGRLQLQLPAIKPVRKPPGEEGVEGEPTPTLAEDQLRGLLANQLRTSITLDEAKGGDGRGISFTAAATMSQLTSVTRGTQSLHSYRELEGRDRHIEYLRACGLSDAQIRFKLEHDPEEEEYREKRRAEDQGGPGSKRGRGYGANPVTVAETLAAIRETVRTHGEAVTQPDKYRGAVKLSRHEMEIEQALARGRSKKDLLDHLVVMEARPGLYAVAPTGPQADNDGDEGQGADDATEPIVWQGPLKVLSSSDVAAHRVAVDDIRAMPRFAKFSPGTPTQHVYVRNLSRKVDCSVLRSVFGRFEVAAPLPIKVLQKGRLKGSAFITFNDVSTAQRAVEETNGYVLEGKPMVLEYGKGPPREA